MSYVQLSEGGFQVVYACGPGSPELSKSYMDMASKLSTFTFTFTPLTPNVTQDYTFIQDCSVVRWLFGCGFVGLLVVCGRTHLLLDRPGVAKMTQMRQDNLANALRLVVSACGCQPAAEPRYRPWTARRAWSNASAGAIWCQCCRGSSLRQWFSWLRMRLRSRTLLRLPRQLGGLRRGLYRPSGSGSYK